MWNLKPKPTVIITAANNIVFSNPTLFDNFATIGLNIANAINGIVVINPATVLFISNIAFNGPTIAPTAVIGVLRISPKKTTPNKINILLFFFVIVPPK